MIRVVVMDDEPVIVRNLSRLIERADSAFEVVGQANNGEEGLRLVKELNPDLLFADIAMPVMTGLEMMEKLRENSFSTPVVILSGYSDFEKAQRALQLDALDYLVKPINPLDFPGFLNKIKEKILPEKTKKETDFFRRALFPENDDGDMSFREDGNPYILIKACLGPYGISRSPAGPDQSSRSREEDLRSAIGKSLSDGEEYWLTGDLLPNEFIVILKSDDTPPDVIASRILRHYTDREDDRSYINLAFSEEKIPPARFQRELNRLENLLKEESRFAFSTLLSSSTRPVRDTPQEEKIGEDLNHLKTLFSASRWEVQQKAAEEILTQCEEHRISQRKLQSLLVSIVEALTGSENRDRAADRVYQALQNSRNYHQLGSQFGHVLAGFREELISQKEDDREHHIMKIRRYIDEHFRENLKVRELAERFNMNYSYLCIAFKKHFGNSPNEYLTERRLAAAEVLMGEDKDLSIKDVARAVGYEDPYYFSRVFKTNRGISPTEYKQN